MRVDLPRRSLAHNPFLATNLACTYFSRTGKTRASVNNLSFSLSSFMYRETLKVCSAKREEG